MTDTTTEAKATKVDALKAEIGKPVQLSIEEQLETIQKGEHVAAELKDEVSAMVVDSEAKSVRLTTLLSIVAGTSKRLEEARMALTRPLKQKAQAIEAIFKGLETALDEITKGGKAKQTAYIRAENERLQAEARKRAEEAARVAAEEAERRRKEAEAAKQVGAPPPVFMPAPLPVAAPPLMKGVKTESGSNSLRKKWSFVVFDSAAVPRSYLEVSDAAIREAIRKAVADAKAAGAALPGIEIPGVEIFEEDDLTVRAAR